FVPFNALRMTRPADAEQILRKLLVDQEPIFLRDTRQMTEGLVRGKYVMATTGVEETLLNEFKKQGVGTSIKATEVPEFTYGGAVDSLFRFRNAPHPNVAKLFANWIFTKEGQTIYYTAYDPPRNSRRKDVSVNDQDTF